MTANSLIDDCLKEIAKEYKPGLLAWLKKQPDLWVRVLDLEGRINQAALSNNETGLKQELSEYKAFLFAMREDFNGRG